MIVGLAATALVAALDQIVKAYVESVLEPGEFVSLFGPHIGWQLVYNPGGAFGLPAPSWVFLLVTAVVVVVVASALTRAPSRLQALAFGMLLGGALGNVVDRLLRPTATGQWVVGDGEVVDFVAWGAFPRFNVADAAITVGFVLLLVALWRDDRSGEPSQAPAEGDHGQHPRPGDT